MGGGGANFASPLFDFCTGLFWFFLAFLRYEYLIFIQKGQHNHKLQKMVSNEDISNICLLLMLYAGLCANIDHLSQVESGAGTELGKNEMK